MFEQEPPSTWKAAAFWMFSMGLLIGFLYAVGEMIKHVLEGK